MRTKKCIIQNISSQTIQIVYNNIDKTKSISDFNYPDGGVLHVDSNSSVDIEHDRLNIQQINFLLKKNLITFKCRMVDVPQSNFDLFDYAVPSTVTAVINTAVSVTPVVSLGLAKYWNIKNLPVGFSFDKMTGLISGGFSQSQIGTAAVELIGVSRTNRVLIKNIIFNVKSLTGLLSFNPSRAIMGLTGRGILLRK